MFTHLRAPGARPVGAAAHTVAGGRSRPRFAAAIGLAVLATLALALPVAAHEQRTVEGYDFVVGFIGEPVFVGQKSGLEFSVTQNGEPVEGLEETLQAEVTKGDATRDLPLGPRFGQPGWYQSYFFPTEEGAYTFRIFGTIDGSEIDESFTSGPETFSEVEAATSGQFPVQFPATADLVSRAQRGSDAAGLVPVALGLGGAGLLAGLLALAMALGARRRA
jgi:hypothetical protein